MVRYHGSIRIQSSFKEDWYYFTVEADDLQDATMKAKEKYSHKVVLDIRIGLIDEAMESFLARGGSSD